MMLKHRRNEGWAPIYGKRKKQQMKDYKRCLIDTDGVLRGDGHSKSQSPNDAACSGIDAARHMDRRVATSPRSKGRMGAKSVQNGGKPSGEQTFSMSWETSTPPVATWSPLSSARPSD